MVDPKHKQIDCKALMSIKSASNWKIHNSSEVSFHGQGSDLLAMGRLQKIRNMPAVSNSPKHSLLALFKSYLEFQFTSKNLLVLMGTKN